MKRASLLLIVALLWLPSAVLTQVLPGSPFQGGSGGGAAFNGGDVTGQTNVCGPDATTNVEIGSCANDANAGTGGTSVCIGNGCSNAGNAPGNVCVGSTCSGGVSTVGIGASVDASGARTIAIGFDATASALNSQAYGHSAVSSHADSTVVGFSTTSTTANQVRLGNAGASPANQFIVGGTPPTVSACGTTPSVVTGSTTAGKLTTGSGGTVQSCTLTFPTAWTTAPSCVANNETVIVLLRAVTTTTTLVIDAAVAGTMESDVISFICLGGV